MSADSFEVIERLYAQLAAKDAEIARLQRALNLIDDHCQDGSHFSMQILKIIDAALNGNDAQARSE